MRCLLQIIRYSLFFSTLFAAPAIFAATYPMPPAGDDIVGKIHIVTAKPGQTLTDIGNKFDVGYHEITQANPSLPADAALRGGEQVIVPTEYILPPFRKGIVVNMPELRLYYFTPDGKSVMTFPVGLGRMNWRTPLATTSVIRKEVLPVWNVPKSIHADVLARTGINLPPAVQPGPDNPLGHFAMFLGVPGYLIHGNNQSWSVGQFISSGCIRMHNTDVERLFTRVTLGTPVHIINYAYKAGWKDGKLYLESQEPITDLKQAVSSIYQPSINDVIAFATKNRPIDVNWKKVNDIALKEHGMPIAIGDTTVTAENNNVINQQLGQN